MYNKILLKILGLGKQCNHFRVLETMACDAVCRDCGRNLGFIGNWRAANKNNIEASEIPNDPANLKSWRSR